jgi:hypothetical protein
MDTMTMANRTNGASGGSAGKQTNSLPDEPAGDLLQEKARCPKCWDLRAQLEELQRARAELEKASLERELRLRGELASAYTDCNEARAQRIELQHQVTQLRQERQLAIELCRFLDAERNRLTWERGQLEKKCGEIRSAMEGEQANLLRQLQAATSSRFWRMRHWMRQKASGLKRRLRRTG